MSSRRKDRPVETDADFVPEVNSSGAHEADAAPDPDRSDDPEVDSVAGAIDHVDEGADADTELGDDTDHAGYTHPDYDVEAAMEEDAEGLSQGGSRRSPVCSSGQAAHVYGDFASPAPPRLRSGLEEADWFNRFRERLAAESSQPPTDHTAQAGGDPDDRDTDEAEEYSESQ